MMKLTLRAQLMSCALISTGMFPMAVATAQIADDDAEAVQETIIVTGARGKPRSVSDSPVPVDVLSEEDIAAVPFTDANDILRTLVPSYTLSRQPISDGASFIRPAQLRGLPTDKTLVLVNSKRRHRAALVSIGGSGTQGPDIATIPAAALKSVEVLRDGAAAQYGSDAIAGVINFILKDSAEGGTMTFDVGEYYEGDGFQYTISGNIGLPLGDSGFLNLTGEITEADATSRSEQYCESWACVDPNDPRYLSGSRFDTSIAGYSEDTFVAGLDDANIGQDDVVQPWGQPNLEAIRFFANSGYTVNEYVDLYGFANYSQSTSDGSFFYRYPGNGTIENVRLEDGSLWSSLEIFPGGFTPRFEGEVIDFSATGGLRGALDNGFGYDFSARFGSNEIKYTLMNTVNPSLGPDSPTEFEPGDLINEEFQLQADFSQEFETGLASPLLLAFGASYLDESYEVVEGEEASYVAGPYSVPDPHGLCTDEADFADRSATAAGAGVADLDCTNSSDPVYQVLGVGSNGFPGYSPEFSDIYERDSFGVYADLSADVTDRLFLQGAVRFEDYSDFDSETVWKLASKFDLTDTVALRGSVGTGFRAPTAGQQGTTNVSTRLPNGQPVATGLFPASGPVAQALGAEPLRPETSTNYSFGVTAGLNNISLTVDFYRIELDDRINAISTLDVSSDPADGDAYENYLALVNAGVAGAESIGGVFYFTNAFDTITQGVDIVATYGMDWTGGASTTFTGSVNYNTTEIDGDVGTDPSGVPFLNEEGVFDFENGNPEWRGVFTVVHETGPIMVTGRANYYGSYEQSDGGSSISQIQEFDPVVQFDLEGAYQVNDILTLSLGARNIFDTYPDEGEFETCCGRIYRSDSVVDWQGGYYYAKAVARF
ncbi:MAG: TonB-dependent receptor [Henriciella sp.]|nr:TonB-dependent receptor [Henriciella sp.]